MRVTALVAVGRFLLDAWKTYALYFAVLSVGLTAACSSTCENAGISVDGAGNIIVRTEEGFISPNSSILRRIIKWPGPPGSEQASSFTQGYALSRDRAMYLLASTSQHPNLVYQIDLSDGKATAIGPSGRSSQFHQTWIAASGQYAYSVDQSSARIWRANLSKGAPVLSTFIAGPRTRLKSPVGVAADENGQVCVLDSGILCYSPNERGNAVPTRVLDLKKLVGYANGWDLVFNRSGHLVVSGASDPHGLKDFSIAVVDIGEARPRVVRVVSGPRTLLRAPRLAVDDRGDILALVDTESSPLGERSLLAFTPDQHGDVAPSSIRKPAASISPFGIAVDHRSGDVAMLGAYGIALYRSAARRSLENWPAETTLPFRGESIAFGRDSSLIVANELGNLETLSESRLTKASGSTVFKTTSLHEPEFIAKDQTGRFYVASTRGVIVPFPRQGERAKPWIARSFRADFYISAFAPDAAGYFYFSSPTNNAIVVAAPENRQTELEGPQSGLNDPSGLVVNKDGLLYVANSGAKNVLFFARGASGNSAPVARLDGPATQLIAPQALAIDATGRLYVFDGPQHAGKGGAPHYVRVFSANARGNVAPLRSYEVNTTCWADGP